MEMKWYYQENGTKIGPVTNEEIVNLIEAAKTQPLAIWNEDMPGASGWAVDAPATGPLAAPDAKAETKKLPEQIKPTLRRRLRNELIEYLKIAGYLAVCFGALLFFKAAILESEGIEPTRVGLAIVKALILGKFVLMLETLKVGQGRKASRALVLDILKKALLFTVLLLIMNTVEGVVLDYLHGEDVRKALTVLQKGTRPEALAEALLMFLILVPYFGYRELADKLGNEELSKLLFTRQPLQKEA